MKGLSQQDTSCDNATAKVNNATLCGSSAQEAYLLPLRSLSYINRTRVSIRSLDAMMICSLRHGKPGR